METPAHSTRIIAHLWLRIETDQGYRDYQVQRLKADPSVASIAWRLWRGGEAYDVCQMPHGVECTCADFVWRRQHTEKKCKHVEALRAVGLLKG